MPEIHTGVALGILRFLQRKVDALGADGTQRVLTAIGLLDPCPHFTRELHAFRSAHSVDDQARELLSVIDGIAKDEGGAEADFAGLEQCIAELEVLGQATKTSLPA
jgi:hypothetical protein